MAKKIGIVCFPTYGGSGIIATELGKGLALSGYEIHFISSSMPQRLDGFQKSIYYHEVHTYEYPLLKDTPYVLSLTSKIVEISKTCGLDVLHVHYAIPHATAAYLAKQILAQESIYLPIVTTLHGTDITLVGQNKAYAPVVQFSIDVSDVVTAVSKFLREETYKVFSVTQDIHVIYNFVDLGHRFSPHTLLTKKQLICSESEYLIVHVSNLRKVKRVRDVVEIFHLIQKKVDASLLVIGDGPERSIMQKHCKSLQIDHKVKFLGNTGAIEEILYASDLMLMPSESESFGLAALEAMASYTPVISTRTGGIPELIVDGRAGFICEIGNIEEMAQKALHILSPRHLSQFKETAYKQAQKFDMPLIIPSYMKLYESLIDTSPQKALVGQ